MTVTCPSGHRSEAADYCDDCGLRIDPGPAAVAPDDQAPDNQPPDSEAPDSQAPASQAELGSASAPAAGSAMTAPVPSTTSDRDCPSCGEAVEADTRFCEECGFDVESGVLPGAATGGTRVDETTWVAVIRVDRERYDEVDVDGIDFPQEPTERRLSLDTERARIGRGRAAADDRPEIDLSVPPVDIGVSHDHAELIRSDDGWSLIDRGSTNGTFLNGRSDAVGPDRPIELHAGDQIHLGAFTTITIERSDANRSTAATSSQPDAEP